MVFIPADTCVNGGYQEKKVWDNGRIRKLTPVEYERLQTLPDNFTERDFNLLTEEFPPPPKLSVIIF